MDSPTKFDRWSKIGQSGASLVHYKAENNCPIRANTNVSEKMRVIDPLGRV